MSSLALLRLLNAARSKFCLKPTLISNSEWPFQLRNYSTDSQGRDLVPSFGFLDVKEKNKNTYVEMIEIFINRDKERRGQIEFIYAALRHMKDFGVDKDLDVYKKLIDVFPKLKMVPTNIFQAEFMHYPKHQQCAIHILEQMEENGVMPDWSMQDQLISIFGQRGYPVRRYWRMMYWMPKFKNASPWPLLQELPNETLELAKLGVMRMTSVDAATEVKVYYTVDIADSLEDTWIVSGQSKMQRILINWLPEQATLYVDGGYRLWLRDKAITYFTLTTDTFRKFEEPNYDDVSNLLSHLKEKPPERCVHEEDGVIVLGVACSGTSTPDSMLSWVRALTVECPRLGHLQVLFRLSRSARDQATPPPPTICPPVGQIPSS